MKQDIILVTIDFGNYWFIKQVFNSIRQNSKESYNSKNIISNIF